MKKTLLKRAKQDSHFRKILIAAISKQSAKTDLRKLYYDFSDIIDDLSEYQKDEFYKKDYEDQKDSKEYSDILKEMKNVNNKFSKHLKRMGYRI